jgi:hypothetical protein
VALGVIVVLAALSRQENGTFFAIFI